MDVIPLIINGLHRSGTTMTERLFDSQPDITCFPLYFQIIRAIAYAREFTDKGEIMTEAFDEAPNKISEKNDFAVRSHMLMDHIQRVYSPYLETPRQAEEGDAMFGLDRQTVLGFSEILATHGDLSDVAGLLQKIGRQIDVKVCATRWTTHHRYAPIFLKNPDAYWLEVVRNPYARIVSERVSHAGNFPVVIEQQQDSLDFMARYQNPRYKVLKYEDLCNDTDNVLKDLSQWLGVEVGNVDLRAANGSPFRPNTSDNRRKGRDIYEKDESLAARIGALDQDRWRTNASPLYTAILNNALNFHGLYQKENTGPSKDLLGKIIWGKTRASIAAKTSVKTLLSRTGFALKRVPRH